MTNYIGCGLEEIINKIKGAFVCILDNRRLIFYSEEEFRRSDMANRTDISSISVEDGLIVLELKKMYSANDMNSLWVQAYIKEHGREPSFFDF